MKWLQNPKNSLVLATGMLALLPAATYAGAQQQVKIPQKSITYEETPRVTLPLVICWFDGKKNLYIQTDASDRTIATQQGVNYVPQLENAIDAPNGAVDDIYVFSNSKETDQYNILPSEPKPVGPDNADKSYTPLWRVSSVTWREDVKQTTLKSEKEVLDAQTAGLLTITKTRIVLNCPVIYTDAGGLLQGAVVHLKDGDRDDSNSRTR